MNLRFRIFVTLLALLSPFVQASAVAKEALKINNIFIPQEGFDDNDNIQFVLDGQLKNACYRLGASHVRVDGQVITVSVEAQREEDAYCIQNDHLLPEAILAAVPFYKEVEVGVLKAGSYTIRYEGSGAEASQTFNVAVAPSNRIDSMSYAPVENASVESLVMVGDTLKLRLSGMLTSSCMHLRDEALVSTENNVVVVQPLIKVDFASKCLMYLRPFSKEVEIQNLPKGRYLLHIRSMNGHSLNRVVSVCSPDTDGRCASLSREMLTR